MKSIHEKQVNKVWNFYFPTKKILNVTGFFMFGAILFSSCLDPHLETVADIKENFAGITSKPLLAVSLFKLIVILLTLIMKSVREAEGQKLGKVNLQVHLKS